jgi:hypothetical protein
MSLVVLRRKYNCTRNGNRCVNNNKVSFNGNQNVAMNRKYQAIRNSKITTKKNIHRNKHFPTGHGDLGSETKNKTMGYHSYYNKRCRNGCNEKATVKSRVGKRKTEGQKILEKKLKVLQRIKCDLKATGGIKPLKQFKCPIEIKNSNKSAGYTRKENSAQYCSTITKDLKLAGSGKSYEEMYACLVSDKAYNCQNEKDDGKFKDPSRCIVY